MFNKNLIMLACSIAIAPVFADSLNSEMQGANIVAEQAVTNLASTNLSSTDLASAANKPSASQPGSADR